MSPLKIGSSTADVHTRAVFSVEVLEDTKIPNAATIKIFKQDHTLANMIRSYVLSPLSPLCLTCPIANC
jgi:hypothetical protein